MFVHLAHRFGFLFSFLFCVCLVIWVLHPCVCEREGERDSKTVQSMCVSCLFLSARATICMLHIYVFIVHTVCVFVLVSSVCVTMYVGLPMCSDRPATVRSHAFMDYYHYHYYSTQYWCGCESSLCFECV